LSDWQRIPDMLFNSLIFLYLFLPLTLALVFIVPGRFKNSASLVASLVFYAWGGVSYTGVLAVSILLNYFSGRCIERSPSIKSRKAWFSAGLVLNLLLLIVFKYTHFVLENLNVLSGLFGWSPVVVNDFILPLGISFYTFKAISYLITVKRQETPAEKNLINFALYLSMFPQVMAGPIDRYKTLAGQIHQRTVNLEQFASGIRRFSLGLFKKVVIASPMAYVADAIFKVPFSQLSLPLTWLGAICFTLQIYYDFSGYTDMAIGLGRMLGFTFTENFNFPYISRSIGEFWKRWHITLSTWLRDYLFLPLAYSGSRKLSKNMYFRIKTDQILYIYASLITFLVCGIWHGAAWNFVIWGLIQGVLISFERTRPWKWLNTHSRPLTHLYFLFFVILSMVFFRAGSLPDALRYISVMIGLKSQPMIWNKMLEFMNLEFIVVGILAVLGSTPFFLYLLRFLNQKIKKDNALLARLSFQGYQLSSILLVFVFLTISSIYLISKTHTPFIYFRF